MTTAKIKNVGQSNHDGRSEELWQSTASPDVFVDELRDESSLDASTWNHHMLMELPPVNNPAQPTPQSSSAPLLVSTNTEDGREKSQQESGGGVYMTSAAAGALPGSFGGHSTAVAAMGELFEKKPNLTQHVEGGPTYQTNESPSLSQQTVTPTKSTFQQQQSAGVPQSKEANDNQAMHVHVTLQQSSEKANTDPQRTSLARTGTPSPPSFQKQQHTIMHNTIPTPSSGYNHPGSGSSPPNPGDTTAANPLQNPAITTDSRIEPVSNINQQQELQSNELKQHQDRPLFTPPRGQKFATVPVSPLTPHPTLQQPEGSFFDPLYNAMDGLTQFFSGENTSSPNADGDLEANCSDWTPSMLLPPSLIPTQTAQHDFVLDGMENVFNADNNDKNYNNSDNNMLGSDTSLDFYSAMNDSDNNVNNTGKIDSGVPPNAAQVRKSRPKTPRRRNRQSCRDSVASVTALEPPEEGDPDDSFLWLFHDKEEFMDLVKEVTHFGRNQNWKKKILGVSLAVASVCVFYDLIFGSHIWNGLTTFLEWMADHVGLAVFAFVGMFAVSTFVFIPPTLLIFGAGYAFCDALNGRVLYAIMAALTAVYLGSMIGAMLAFARSRYMARDLVNLFARRYPIVKAADTALNRNGFKIMLLLRLCPLIPFNGLNYALGITGVSCEDYLWALMIGSLPMQLLTVIMGATTEALYRQRYNESFYNDHTISSFGQKVAYCVLLFLGVFWAIVAVVYTWKKVKKELKKELDMEGDDFDTLLRPYPTSQGTQQAQDPQDTYEFFHESLGIEAKYLPEPIGDEEWYWVWA